MANNQYLKDPSAVLDYVFDWTEWLATGETIDPEGPMATPPHGRGPADGRAANWATQLAARFWATKSQLTRLAMKLEM